MLLDKSQEITMTTAVRHTDTVHAQFDPQAKAYLTSAVLTQHGLAP